MATPRASVFWEDSTSRMNYFAVQGEEGEEDVEQQEDEDAYDGRTPLDRTIDRIGMGSYQWILLSLCGFGWLADNMWLEAVAIILPRVQQHYSVPDSYIGALSSSMFGGMMFGAVGWGTCSDLMGRSTAFNLTLFFTAAFGLLASLATSFLSLCIILFLLGSAVGGSMPTDGTLILEYMPKGKQYLVTALSVFFSFGSVLSAVVALLVVPKNSCRASQDTPCDVDKDNLGWKYLFTTLGLVTLSMFIARMVFFRLHESPRFLVHTGRKQEALQALQLISRYNGNELSLELHDVDDTPRSVVGGDTDLDVRTPFLRDEEENGMIGRADAQQADVVFDADIVTSPTMKLSAANSPIPDAGLVVSPGHPRQNSTSLLRVGPDRLDYSSTAESPTPLDSHSFITPSPTMELRTPLNLSLQEQDGLSPRRTPSQSQSPIASPGDAAFKEVPLTATSLTMPSPSGIIPPLSSHGPSPTRARLPRRTLPRRRLSTASSFYEVQKKVWWLPTWIRRPLWAWMDRVATVLEPEWRKTTLLMWGAWFCMAHAYTMFNVYLPKLLETSASEAVAPKSLEDSLWDVVIFTLGGCPGALVGAWMIKTPLGRRWSLASSTFVTALFCVFFIFAEALWAVRASTVGISLSSTTMWAVLYGWTPDLFDTHIRGTACGIASALSRIGGLIAPLLGGALLMINRSVPVYTSVVVFVIAGICVLLIGGGERSRGKGGGGLMH